MKTLINYSIAILFTSFLFTSCIKDFVCLEGQGPKETRVLDLADFQGLELQGAYDIDITYGPTQKVVATGHRNMIDKVNTRVADGVWKMGLNRGCFRDYDLSFVIELPYINEVAIPGTGNVSLRDFTHFDDLNLSIGGHGDISILTPMKSDVTSISIAGHGSFYGFPLETRDCHVKINGHGDCEVHVTDELDITIKGTGSVTYKGDPQVKQNIPGNGSVERTN